MLYFAFKNKADVFKKDEFSYNKIFKIGGKTKFGNVNNSRNYLRCSGVFAWSYLQETSG